MTAVGDFAKFASIQSPRVWRILLSGLIVGSLILIFGPARLRPNLAGSIGDLHPADYVLVAIDYLIGFAVCWMALGALGSVISSYQLSKARRDEMRSYEKLYGSLDVDERRSLASFIEVGLQSVSERYFNSASHEHEIPYLQALYRLADRGFVRFNVDHYGTDGGTKVIIGIDHFKTLSAYPRLVKSNVPAKLVG
jgi:hypothetical protein